MKKPLAVLAVPILAALALIPAADATDTNSAPTCFGRTVDIAGTSKADNFEALSGETGHHFVIRTRGGNDRVWSLVENRMPISVCLGDGDDWYSGPVNELSAGGGKDNVIVRACFDNGLGDLDGQQLKVYNAEQVTILPCDRPQGAYEPGGQGDDINDQ